MKTISKPIPTNVARFKPMEPSRGYTGWGGCKSVDPATICARGAVAGCAGKNVGDTCYNFKEDYYFQKSAKLLTGGTCKIISPRFCETCGRKKSCARLECEDAKKVQWKCAYSMHALKHLLILTFYTCK